MYGVRYLVNPFFVHVFSNDEKHLLALYNL